MKIRMKKYLQTAAGLGAACLVSLGAQAQVSNDVVKIGVIVDRTGVYSGIGGPGGIRAVEMAVKDFGGKVNGKPIQIVSADYQSKVDIAASKAREWIDRDQVDMIIESTDSGAALALQKLGEEKKRVIIFAGSATTALTNDECTPYGIHYVYDTYAMASGTARAVVQEGGNSWFFLTADYAFGKAIEKDSTKIIQDMGGKVLGSIRHPLSASDFSSFLLQAQASKAKVIGFANAGKDTQNAVRQAAEFGIAKGGQKLATLLMFDTDIKGMGLPIAQGLLFTTGFYWDYSDETRKWSNRFYAINKLMPTMVQAGMYSATMHYLQSIQATGSDDADVVVRKMKETPINDFFAKNGKILANGRMVHDMYLAEVKTPQESKAEWDIIKIKRTIPGDQAFQPLSESSCKLIKK